MHTNITTHTGTNAGTNAGTNTGAPKPASLLGALIMKEWYSYAIAPLFYGITVFFVLFLSIWLFYFQRFFGMNTASLRPFFAGIPLGYILVIPVLTMKSWAEERRLGTIEILLTLPFSDWELVLGKFLAALGALGVMLLLTLPVPLTVAPLGSFDPGVIAGEYLGALLFGGAAVSLGLVLSSVCRHQAGAFLWTAAVLLVMLLINQFTMTQDLPVMVAAALNMCSLAFHFESFSRGMLDSRDVAFFLLVTFGCLFLTTRVLLARKWR